MVSTGRVLVAVVQICFKAKKWDLLNEHATLLAKRRFVLNMPNKTSFLCTFNKYI